MTQSAPAAPGAPATTEPAPAAPGAQPASTAPANTAPGQDPNTPVDISSLPANVQKLIGDLRQEAGSHRQAKTAAERQRNAMLKALGLNEDGSAATDPEAAVNQLTQRATEAENTAWGATVKLSVFQRAGELGANPGALLDSLSFVDSLDDLVDTNPSSAAFQAALDAKIKAALAANPTLAAGKPNAGRSGGEFDGGSGAGVPISEEQMRQMTPAERVKALEEGKLSHLL